MRGSLALCQDRDCVWLVPMARPLSRFLPGVQIIPGGGLTVHERLGVVTSSSVAAQQRWCQTAMTRRDACNGQISTRWRKDRRAIFGPRFGLSSRSNGLADLATGIRVCVSLRSRAGREAQGKHCGSAGWR